MKKWLAAGLILAGQLLLGRYSQLLLGLDIHNRWSRNFFFLGLPFFLLGYGLRQKDELLARWFEPAGRKAAVLAASVLMAGLSLAECAFSLNGPAPDSSGDLFVSSIPLAILVFLLARYCFEEEWRQYAPVAFMLEIGRRHSLGIYVLHPMLLNFVVAAVGLHWYTPMLAFAASLAVSALAHTCVKRIPFGKQQ